MIKEVLNYVMIIYNLNGENDIEGRIGRSLSRAETLLTHHESRIFKFYFKALHVSRETCASRVTKNVFLKTRFSVKGMI